MNIEFRSILAVLAAGAALVTVLPAQAKNAHYLVPAQPSSSKDAPLQQCERRDTYNDVYYVNCNTLHPFGASREGD